MHFRIILPLPKVLPPSLEISHGRRKLVMTNVNRRSSIVSQHAINALESMKEEDKYGNYIANKTRNERFQYRLHLYKNLTSFGSRLQTDRSSTAGRVQCFICNLTRNRHVTSTKPSGNSNGLLVKFATVVMMHGGIIE